jgi:RND family efflux transporter MFP subunit
MEYYNFKNIILFFSVSLFIACGDDKKQEEKILRPVQYETVGYLGGGKLRTFSGTARTDKIVNLSFRSNGIITEFHMKLGQKVKKGELLAKLDNVQARLNHENAVSSMNSSASQMNTAKLNLDRIRSLYEKGSAALSDYEAAKNSFRTAQASHESAKRTVQIQKEQIRYGYLYAPADGAIAAVNAEIDENVSSGQNIGVLNAGSTIEISLGLPESVINTIEEGMKVKVVCTSLSGKEFEGVVSEVAPSLDANTSTYPVRVMVNDPSPEIKSGMAANVTFDFGNAGAPEQTLIVPANAIGEDSEGRFVFLVDGDETKATVKKQYVEIGSLSSNGFTIEKGLSAGQKIATAGLQTLLDGQQVRLQ